MAGVALQQIPEQLPVLGLVMGSTIVGLRPTRGTGPRATAAAPYCGSLPLRMLL